MHTKDFPHVNIDISFELNSQNMILALSKWWLTFFHMTACTFHLPSSLTDIRAADCPRPLTALTHITHAPILNSDNTPKIKYEELRWISGTSIITITNESRTQLQTLPQNETLFFYVSQWTCRVLGNDMHWKKKQQNLSGWFLLGIGEP